MNCWFIDLSATEHISFRKKFKNMKIYVKNMAREWWLCYIKGIDVEIVNTGTYICNIIDEYFIDYRKNLSIEYASEKEINYF